MTPEQQHDAIHVDPERVRSVTDYEAYCVDSGAPVRWEAGDRCVKHGTAATPCYAALRDPRCTHPRWPTGANGSDRCPECGAVAATVSGGS